MIPEVITVCSYNGHSNALLAVRSYSPSQEIVWPLSKEQLLTISRIVTSSGSHPVPSPLHMPHSSTTALPSQTPSQSIEAFSPPHTSQSSITADPPHSPKQSSDAQVPLSAVASGL